MNRINLPNVSKYKGAIIQLTCSECNLGDEFFIEFSGVSKVKPSNCNHLNINLLLSSERNSVKMTCSFNCKFCKFNKMIELFNNMTWNESGSIRYKCEGCKQGNVTVGYLFQNEIIDISDFAPPLQPTQQKIVKKEEPTIPKINIIFIHNNKEYKINVEEELSIPEAFHKLSETNQELTNLDIRAYLKNDKELAQFTSIKKLGLKNGDKITIKLRVNQGW